MTGLAALGLSYKIIRAVVPYTGSMFVPVLNKYIIINGCTDGIGRAYA